MFLLSRNYYYLNMDIIIFFGKTSKVYIETTKIFENTKKKLFLFKLIWRFCENLSTPFCCGRKVFNYGGVLKIVYKQRFVIITSVM